MAVVHVGIPGVVSVLRGNGDGTLQGREDYVTGGSPRHITTGDLNRDGKLDLATANYAQNSVSILINSGAPTVGVAQTGTQSVRFAVAPNPIASGARLHFQVLPGERVTARLFDTRGSFVTTVYDGIPARSSFDIPWDARGRTEHDSPRASTSYVSRRGLSSSAGQSWWLVVLRAGMMLIWFPSNS